METRKLGNTDIKVSLICLGSMTWGEQNSETEGHAQLDMAADYGINFIDVAEMYPVPPKEETQGRTEEILGSWLKRQPRENYIVATKVTGRSDSFDYLGRGETRLNATQINEAVNTSLKRLQTDYIDLYQLHWPERATNFFGQLGYNHPEQEDAIALEETLQALQTLVESGKIRHIGLSNETAWGMMHCLKLAETQNLPRVMSIQNPYNLLNRSFEIGLAEGAIREECGLLAYSPLGFGVLSGKYLDGKKPQGARLTLFDRFQRYTHEKAQQATKRYVELAQQHHLTPAQLALAFVNRQRFVTSNIIGATTLEQLKENIETFDLQLSDEIMEEIEAIHKDIPNPCP